MSFENHLIFRIPRMFLFWTCLSVIIIIIAFIQVIVYYWKVPWFYRSIDATVQAYIEAFSNLYSQNIEITIRNFSNFVCKYLKKKHKLYTHIHILNLKSMDVSFYPLKSSRKITKPCKLMKTNLILEIQPHGILSIEKNDSWVDAGYCPYPYSIWYYLKDRKTANSKRLQWNIVNYQSPNLSTSTI